MGKQIQMKHPRRTHLFLELGASYFSGTCSEEKNCKQILSTILGSLMRKTDQGDELKMEDS